MRKELFTNLITISIAEDSPYRQYAFDELDNKIYKKSNNFCYLALTFVLLTEINGTPLDESDNCIKIEAKAYSQVKSATTTEEKIIQSYLDEVIDPTALTQFDAGVNLMEPFFLDDNDVRVCLEELELCDNPEEVRRRVSVWFEDIFEIELNDSVYTKEVANSLHVYVRKRCFFSLVRTLEFLKNQVN